MKPTAGVLFKMTGNKINHEHHMMHLGVTSIDWKKAGLEKAAEKCKIEAHLTDGVESWPNHEMMCRIHCAMEATGSISGNKINHEATMKKLRILPVDWTNEADFIKDAEKCKNLPLYNGLTEV
ncbi:Protein of unknown function [Gryllus bimaculatus]|nr:Protein of unknown function [Gryllus bimaculatus]